MFVFSELKMQAVSHLVKDVLPAYLHDLPIPDSLLGWFQLGFRDWLRLVPFGMTVGGLSYLTVQVKGSPDRGSQHITLKESSFSRVWQTRPELDLF